MRDYEMTIRGGSVAELKANLLAAAAEVGGAAVSTDKADPKKPAATAAKKADAPAIDFKKEVSPLIIKLADKNRAKAVEVLGTFGVARGVDLKPEQYAEVIVALNAALEAVEDDLG